MILDVVVAFFAGILCGVLAGLIPGIHTNLVASGILFYIGYFKEIGISDVDFVIFIVSMTSAQIFIDFIPSVFLGAPEESSFLSVLPGHKLLLEGKGYEAVVYGFYGCLFSIPAVFFWSIIFYFLLYYFYSIIYTFTPFVLFFISAYSILRERRKLFAFVFFSLSGIFGIVVFRFYSGEPLLPMLSGLFGVSGLVLSIGGRSRIDNQTFSSLREIDIFQKGFLKNLISGFFVSPFCSFLPGIGSGQASFIASEIVGKSDKNERAFLFLNGLSNGIVIGLGFATLFAVDRIGRAMMFSRTGSGAVLGEIVNGFEVNYLFLIMVVLFISGVVSFFIGLFIARTFSGIVNSFNYNIVSFIVIIFVVLINFIFGGFYAVFILSFGTLIGFFNVVFGARRINLIGCLVVPSILNYL